MTLEAGTKLGSYEIVSMLGAGGMGEVYKARDPRLERSVAIKVLPAALAESGEALARFEREARAVAALNHPNILGIHDFASHDGKSFVVMELLEGESLRARLEQGPLPARRATELAIQMAEGLAAAHERGVIHRDLKPENLWITKEGRLKILDFGLAKQLASMGEDTSAPTKSPATGAGTVLGTLGYMSPEQVRGEPVDARSDLFSFGAVLYEMLTGQRAFQRSTGSETMAAILRDDPPELPATGRTVPPSLERIVGHCLEKRPEQRFHSAHDVAFALQDLSSPEGKATDAGTLAPQRRRAGWAWAAGAALLVAAAAAGGWMLRGGAGPQPTFRQLTQQRGTLSGARFVPGSREVIYSADWAGGASQWYARNLDQPGARVLAGSEGILVSVSRGGDAIGIARTYLSHGVQVGGLYSLPLAGGAPREWASAKVWGAAAGAGNDELAASIGDFGAEMRLEWPLGNVVFTSLDVLRNPAIRGDLLAFVKETGNMLERVSLELVDRSGKVRTLTNLSGYTGLAWGPRGDEIWVSTYSGGESVFLAVDLSGRTRTLLRHAGRLELQDVDAEGRVLAALHSYQRQTFGRAAGESVERDLGWLDAQATTAMTTDGSRALLAPLGDWSGTDGTLYLRPLSGGPAQTMGLGQRQSTVSQDGKWVVTCETKPTLTIVLIPTGPGQVRRIPVPDFEGSDLRADLLPDGNHAIAWGRRRGQPFAHYSVDLETGALKQVSKEKTSPYAFQDLLSPDGNWMAYVDSATVSANAGNQVGVSRTDGTDARVTLSLGPGEAVSGWGGDSASLLIYDRNKVPVEVQRVELASGKRTHLLTIRPADPIGISGLQGVLVRPDSGAYTYNITRKLSQLFLIEGLR